MADVLRRFGPAFRDQHRASLSAARRRAMLAIETCRTAALGGHVERCGDCGHQRIAYDSCRNRNCPECQGLARAQWLADRQAELLDVPYFHVVFTVPAQIEVIAFQNQTVVYDILFRAAAETLRIIAADPKHLGAEIGFLGVLHTWGQNLLHHPHIHFLVPGGGIAIDHPIGVPDRRQIAPERRRLIQMTMCRKEVQLTRGEGFLKITQEQAPKHPRQHLDRQEEPRSTGDPALPVRRGRRNDPDELDHRRDADAGGCGDTGVTLCTCSGDNGAQARATDGLAHVLYPATDLWALACGGTTIGNMVVQTATSGPGTTPHRTGASGGGVSDYFPLPWYRAIPTFRSRSRTGIAGVACRTYRLTPARTVAICLPSMA